MQARCPRCGAPIKGVYRVGKRSNTYYVAVHMDGTQHYLGPLHYKYGTRTNKIVVRGAIDVNRELKYMEEITKAITEERLGREDVINALEEIMKATAELITTATQKYPETTAALTPWIEYMSRIIQSQ
ncbi:hypothetical protein [Vulcanisaeta distributa]|uniref:Uncharacterized protein n=1 Tax=Vulcanisaeta distributa (strain DSM 14429 / JCM 11212 / NBRC 100878 / IC-017) TaxID=572478 RepID=E1QP85_VULDI|nr:hypothetical protein [Vulcanisaeta distributa]ADN50256.1 hypothetical protein Vdis_0865 [Vulcanisaeta distributa DSM 14429]